MNHALWLHSLSPSSAFSGGRGGTEGVVGEAEQEKGHTLCPGWSGKVGPKLPLHAGSEGLATFSPNFRGGLLVAAACSRTSLSGHWRP